MKVTPAAATSASPLRPPGSEPSGGGPFESTIGKSGEPSTSSAPVGAILTMLTPEGCQPRFGPADRGTAMGEAPLPPVKPEIHRASHPELRRDCTIQGGKRRGRSRGTGRDQRAARAGALRDPQSHRRTGSDARTRARVPARAGPPPDRGRPRACEDADDQDDGRGARREL